MLNHKKKGNGGDSQAQHRPAPIRDVEETERAFASGGFELRVTGLEKRSAFAMNFELYQLGQAEVICTRWGTGGWMNLELPGRMAVIIDLGSPHPSVFETSGNAVPATRSTAPILQPDREMHVFRPANSPLFVLSADMRDLNTYFQDLVGPNRAGLEFEPAMDRRSPEGKRFERLVNFALGELKAEPLALENPIYRRQFDDLILSALVGLPGAHERQTEQLSDVDSRQALVHRAEEFMDANVAHPIGMSDVARECACSRTKLYQAFKEERGWTPLQFLVRRRMERARRRLSGAGTGVTVTSVSLDCGYANLSRFAEEYRKLYGETPSMTLTRNR